MFTSASSSKLCIIHQSFKSSSVYTYDVRNIGKTQQRQAKIIVKQESPLGILTGHSDPPHP